MSESVHVSLDFIPDNGGTAVTDRGYSLNILSGENSARPYELLSMALASCLYSTFEDIYKKKRLSCESVSVDVAGKKRAETPKFLEVCDVKFTVRAADKIPGFEKSFELACKYCSIFQTLSKVAEMKTEISFID